MRYNQHNALARVGVAMSPSYHLLSSDLGRVAPFDRSSALPSGQSTRFDQSALTLPEVLVIKWEEGHILHRPGRACVVYIAMPSSSGFTTI